MATAAPSRPCFRKRQPRITEQPMTTMLKSNPGNGTPAPAPAPAPTILVVDDNSTNLKLASEVLEYAGYHVLKAADAEEAQVIIGHSRPDLIFMDLALPGMDGLTLTRKLKAEASTKQIPIIALTAFAMKGDEQKAREAGCDGYIAKPIDTRTLPAQVAEFLALNQSAAATSLSQTLSSKFVSVPITKI